MSDSNGSPPNTSAKRLWRRVASASSRRPRPPFRAQTPAPAPDIGEPSPGWQDVTPELPLVSQKGRSGAGLPRRLAWEWGLVLEARHMPYRLERSAGGYRLLCPADAKDRLLQEIQSYEQENKAPHAPSLPGPMRENTGYTVGIVLLLGLFHGIAQNQWRLFGYDAARSPVPWVREGACDCFEILFHGALWRSVTALTLHADAAHVVGNMGIGLLVLAPLCRELGSGAGWLLTLLAGALGNLLNCSLQGTGHLSLGASTAVFGAVGVLSSLRAAREQRWEPRSVLLPLGAGVTLLAFLGIGKDPQTDVGAHVCGFLVGLALGVAAGLAVRRYGPPGVKLSRALGGLALLLVLYAWRLAFAVT